MFNLTIGSRINLRFRGVSEPIPGVVVGPVYRDTFTTSQGRRVPGHACEVVTCRWPNDPDRRYFRLTDERADFAELRVLSADEPPVLGLDYDVVDGVPVEVLPDQLRAKADIDYASYRARQSTTIAGASVTAPTTPDWLSAIEAAEAAAMAKSHRKAASA